MTHIPFIYRNEGGNSEGIDINLVAKYIVGNSKGVDFTGIVKDVCGNSKGVDFTGIAKQISGDSKGVDFTGFGKYVSGDSEGIDFTGIIKNVGGKSKGVSITGGINYSRGVKDFLIQYATLRNMVDETPEDVFVMQLGLYNKMDGRTSPIINIKGIKNIPRLIKKAFSKKSLEDKI